MVVCLFVCSDGCLLQMYNHKQKNKYINTFFHRFSPLGCKSIIEQPKHENSVHIALSIALQCELVKIFIYVDGKIIVAHLWNYRKAQSFTFHTVPSLQTFLNVWWVLTRLSKINWICIQLSIMIKLFISKSDSLFQISSSLISSNYLHVSLTHTDSVL